MSVLRRSAGVDKSTDAAQLKARHPVCGHEVIPPRVATKQRCAPCEKEFQLKITAEAEIRKKQRQEQAVLVKTARLPHGARFEATYDGSDKPTWRGTLVVSVDGQEHRLEAAHTALIKLIQRLDRTYRKALNVPPHPEQFIPKEWRQQP